MPPPRPPKPEVRAARPERRPSVWAPVPVPTPGVGRSTEDPRTPPLKELAARAARAALVAKPARAPVAAAEARRPLDCRQAWGEVMARTNAVLGAGDVGDSRPQQFLDRNRAISAAYAELAQGDPRMRWAGIASVVSTQAHCAMQDANVAVDRADAVHQMVPPAADAAARAAASQVPVVGPFAAPRAGEAARRAVADQTGPLAEMTRQVQDALYDTNREIFADIYPAVAMYARHGSAGVGGGPGQCGGARPDRPMPELIQSALRRIDDGDIRGGSLILARYEQTEIVQNRIYEDPRRPLLKPAMQLNQIASSVPGVREAASVLMRARRPEVAISTECGEGRPVPFRGDITVAKDRVMYYEALVGEYMRRDQAARDAMSRVIVGRDPLRGGPDYSYSTPPWRSGLP